MFKKSLLLLAGLLVLVPAPASASLTQEYYTWGGHDAVISAFQRTALIFSAGGYQNLFATLASASLAALVIRVMMQLLLGGFRGDGNVAFGAIIPWLISVALFTGGVIPKGTLHIYDQVENKYQAVGDIPVVVVLFASVSNKIERILVEEVTTAGDPVGFQTQAGGKGFLGLYDVAARTSLQALDSSLDPSVAKYIDDCVVFNASVDPGYIQELRKTTTDLFTSFTQAAVPGNMTVLYTMDDSVGEVVTCQAAWTSISSRLQAAGVLNNNIKSACTEMGFDPDQPDQFNDCQTKMSEVVSAQISAGKNNSDFLRSIYLAQSMDAVLSTSSAGEAYSNFSILNKASGTMSTVNQWLPTIRAVILAVTVALTPFLALLMLTPMFGKAIKFIAGSFFFLTIWGVVDATLHQFVVDYANKLYGAVRQYGLGLDAIRMFPGSTEKILAMFGIVRASGLALAATIASSVIGLGASVGAAVGGKIMGDVTQTGAQAEQQVLDPGQKSALRRSNQMSIPTETMANNYSFSQRTTADYAQQMGQMENITGGLEATGGLGGWQKLQHGQGFTNAYRGQGDVKLNQEFMQQAQAMGIPREQAQQISAATVNHGEGLAELRRLQQQGFSGQQAADMYWQGKTVDHMQGKSVGQQGGFTMYRPAEGQDLGRWGQISALWQGGQLIQLQGGALNVATTEQFRASYDKAYSQAISESYRADQGLGESVTKSWGNSATWSQTQAAAQQLYDATSGSVDYSKAITSTMMSSFRNSQVVDERSGKTIDKSAFEQISGGVGTPQVSPIKANIEGGSSWRVTTSDGKSYVVNQTAEEARSMSTSVGETHRTMLSTVRSGQYSETAQKALAQMESVQGTKTASETATISYSRANEMRESQAQAHSRAAEMSANLTKDFIHHTGQTKFGGGQAGDRAAIAHYETLAAQGKTQEIQEEMSKYLAARGINPEALGAKLGRVNGPDQDRAPDPESMREKIDNGTAQIRQDLNKQPNIKSTDPTAQVEKQLDVKPGAVDPKMVKQTISASQTDIKNGQQQIETAGQGIKEETKGALAAPIAAVKETAGFVTDDIKGGLSRIKHAATEAVSLAKDVIQEPAQPQQHRQPAQTQERKIEPQTVQHLPPKGDLK